MKNAIRLAFACSPVVLAFLCASCDFQTVKFSTSKLYSYWDIPSFLFIAIPTIICFVLKKSPSFTIKIEILFTVISTTINAIDVITLYNSKVYNDLIPPLITLGLLPTLYGTLVIAMVFIKSNINEP